MEAEGYDEAGRWGLWLTKRSRNTMSRKVSPQGRAAELQESRPLLRKPQTVGKDATKNQDPQKLLKSLLNLHIGTL